MGNQINKILNSCLFIGLLATINDLELKVHTSSDNVDVKVRNSRWIYRGELFLNQISLLLESINVSVGCNFLLYAIKFIESLYPFGLNVGDVLNYSIVLPSVFNSMLCFMVLEFIKKSSIYFVGSFISCDYVGRVLVESLLICPISCIQAQYCKNVADSLDSKDIQSNGIVTTTKQFIRKNGIVALFNALPLVCSKRFMVTGFVFRYSNSSLLKL